MGPAWARSSALPCGTPSMTSTSTTSPSSFSTAYWATVAPTLPAPTTVILGRANSVSFISSSRTGRPGRHSVLRLALQLRHALDDGGAELRALHFLGAVHEPREVVGDDLLLDRLLEAGDDPVGGVGPAHVAEHHLARQDDRARIHLVLPRVLRRRAVRGLEQRVAGVVVDVGAGRDADAAHLRGQGVGEQIAREVAGRDHVELVGPRQDLLQERVGDGVLDEDLAGGRLAAALVPADRLVAELLLGQRVAPLHEHALGVLLDVTLVHEGHVLAVVLDGVADGGADEPLAAFLGHGLDADRGRVREADLVDLHLLLQELHDLLGFRRPLLPLDARVDVLRVLAEDHHVHLVRALHGRGHALEVLHRAQADVEVEHLAQRHVERAEALADGRGERALDGHQVFADDVERLLGQQVRRAVLAVDLGRLLARVRLRPGDLLPAVIGLLHGGVEDPDRRPPDVGPGAVALDEGDDRVVRHAQLTVVDRDLLALRDRDLACHQTSFLPGFALVSPGSRCTSSIFAGAPVVGSMTWPAFSAEPARNQAICSRVRLCRAWMVTTRPSGFLICTVTGLPGSSVYRPVIDTRSPCSNVS